MKLKDLFEKRAFQFDITNLPDLSDTSSTLKLGTFDGYEIFGSSYYGADGDAYCISDQNSSPIAMVVIRPDESEISGKKYQDIVKIWVRSDQRGKALSTCILAFLIKKLKIKIGTGDSITIKGEENLKKLVATKTFKTSIIDKSNNTLLDIDTVPLEKLFSLPNEYELLFEGDWGNYGNLPYKRLFEHFENPKLQEMRYFRSDDSEWD